MTTIRVGDKQQIYNPKTDKIFCVDITHENIDRIQRYDIQAKTDTDWRFGDKCSANIPTATILFTENYGLLKIDVVPSVDEDVLNWQQQMDGGGRRSRKVKKSKSFKKRPTRRRRSSKARKARKSRATRRR